MFTRYSIYCDFPIDVDTLSKLLYPICRSVPRSFFTMYWSTILFDDSTKRGLSEGIVNASCLELEFVESNIIKRPIGMTLSYLGLSFLSRVKSSAYLDWANILINSETGVKFSGGTFAAMSSTPFASLFFNEETSILRGKRSFRVLLSREYPVNITE